MFFDNFLCFPLKLANKLIILYEFNELNILY